MRLSNFVSSRIDYCNCHLRCACSSYPATTERAQMEVRPHQQRHPRLTALAAHSAALGVQDLSADFQVSSPDGTSLPCSDERPSFCLR